MGFFVKFGVGFILFNVLLFRIIYFFGFEKWVWVSKYGVLVGDGEGVFVLWSGKRFCLVECRVVRGFFRRFCLWVIWRARDNFFYIDFWV